MSRHGASINNVFPQKECTPRNFKRNKISETLIKGKQINQEPYNPSKREKVDSIIDEKRHNKKTAPQFKNKEDCISGTNENAHEYDESASDTDICARNLGNEHKNEEYE